MISEVYSQPIISARKRLPYAAVPLDPWQAVHPETGALYYQESIKKISNKADNAIIDAITDGRIQDPTIARNIRDVLKASLIDAHTRRVNHNYETNLRGVADQVDTNKLEAAMMGVACPNELYDLLRENPSMGSIELAKLSHPLDYTASAEMNAIVFEMLEGRAEMLDEVPRYKIKRVEPELPASIIVRKRAISAELLDDGYIEVVERRSFLVRGDKQACDEVPFVNRMIRNPNRQNELEFHIETELDSEDINVAWLQPTTTSYYACYHPVG